MAESGSVPRSDLAWFEAATAAFERYHRPTPESEVPLVYVLGDTALQIATADSGLRNRFETTYRDCVAPNALKSIRSQIRYDVNALPSGEAFLVSTQADDIDLAELTMTLFASRTPGAVRTNAGAWTIISWGNHGTRARLAFRRRHVLVAAAPGWRSLVKNLAVSHAMAIQEGVAFFHAASVGVAGRCLLLLGDKESGKTTLSLGLAARGHGFLGDEVAALRLNDGMMLPLPLSVGVRAGPGDDGVEKRLRHIGADTVRYPDGTERRRSLVSDLFPDNRPDPVPLGRVVYLTGMASRTTITPVALDRATGHFFSPLAATMWGRERSRRMMGILSRIGQTRCYSMQLGSVASAVEALEALMLGRLGF